MINKKSMKKGETVMLGIPEKYPADIVDALKEYLPSLSSVKSAYLMLMIKNRNDKSYLLIVYTDDEYNKVFSKIAEVAIRYLNNDEKIDFIPFRERFDRETVRGQVPFYKKELY